MTLLCPEWTSSYQYGAYEPCGCGVVVNMCFVHSAGSLVWPHWFRHRTLHFMSIHPVCEIAETQKLSAATGCIPAVSSCPGALGTRPTMCGVPRSTCEFMGTSSTLSTMSVGLVETLLPTPLTTAAPHTAMLPGTAARPVSTTTFTFFTTSWWDPRHRQTITDSTLRQRCWRTIHLSRDDCIACAKL